MGKLCGARLLTFHTAQIASSTSEEKKILSLVFSLYMHFWYGYIEASPTDPQGFKWEKDGLVLQDVQLTQRRLIQWFTLATDFLGNLELQFTETQTLSA